MSLRPHHRGVVHRRSLFIRIAVLMTILYGLGWVIWIELHSREADSDVKGPGVSSRVHDVHSALNVAEHPNTNTDDELQQLLHDAGKKNGGRGKLTLAPVHDESSSSGADGAIVATKPPVHHRHRHQGHPEEKEHERAHPHQKVHGDKHHRQEAQEERNEEREPAPETQKPHHHQKHFKEPAEMAKLRHVHVRKPPADAAPHQDAAGPGKQDTKHRHKKHHHRRPFRNHGPAELPSDLVGTQVAFAIVVSNEDFIDGALAMGWSFQKQSRLVQSGNGSMVAIVPHGAIRESSIERLHFAGWHHVVQVEDLTKKAPRAAWAETFNKLYLFNLTQYSRVASFDVDMLMLHNPDSVFWTKLKDESYVGALGNTPKPGRKPYFQSGMMLLWPSSNTFNSMMEDFETVPENKGVNGRDGAIVRRFYRDRYTNLDPMLSAHLAPDEPLDSVIGFHFRGDWKPWFDREHPPKSDQKAKHGKEVVKQEMGQAYRMWWEHYEELHEHHLMEFDLEQQKKQQEEAAGGGRLATDDDFLKVPYDPKTSLWLMRYTKRSYVQLKAKDDIVRRNMTMPGMVLEVARVGESCDVACALRQSVCIPEAIQFSEVNNCSRMRALFGCATCEIDKSLLHQPFYDTKQHLCSINPLYKKPMRPTCGSLAKDTKRLCPCVSLEHAYAKPVPYTQPMPGSTHMKTEVSEDDVEGKELESTLESLKILCNPSTMTWFSDSSEDRRCFRFLSNPANIASLTPVGHNGLIGRTPKLLATYRTPTLDELVQREDDHSNDHRSPEELKRLDDTNHESLKAARDHLRHVPIRALIKFPQSKFPHEPQSEFVAYLVDRLLAIHRVPTTAFVFMEETLLKQGFSNTSVERSFANIAKDRLNVEHKGDEGDLIKPANGDGENRNDDEVSKQSTERQFAEEEVWEFLLKQKGDDGYTLAAGKTDPIGDGPSGKEEDNAASTSGRRVGVSLQLWMADIHRLADTTLRVPRDVDEWLLMPTPDDIPAEASEYPKHRVSLANLNLMELLDYVIGNTDRSIFKNLYVQGGCERRCTRPLEVPPLNLQQSNAPQFILVDQGKSIYSSAGPEKNVFTKLFSEGLDKPDTKPLMCRFSSEVAEAVLHFSTGKDFVSALVTKLPKSIQKILAGGHGLGGIESRFDEMHAHFKRCQAAKPLEGGGEATNGWHWKSWDDGLRK